jgi:hypothetical protein
MVRRGAYGTRPLIGAIGLSLLLSIVLYAITQVAA